jgi:C4-dicarboxylate-specific signal transduction histidine kinase
LPQADPENVLHHQRFFHFFRPNKVVSVFSARRQIEMAISLVQASFTNNNIAIDFETERDVQLLGIPNEYSQVLLNLLSNAKDAILAQQCVASRVNISIEIADRMGCVVVRAAFRKISWKRYSILISPRVRKEATSACTCPK